LGKLVWGTDISGGLSARKRLNDLRGMKKNVGDPLKQRGKTYKRRKGANRLGKKRIRVIFVRQMGFLFVQVDQCPKRESPAEKIGKF